MKQNQKKKAPIERIAERIFLKKFCSRENEWAERESPCEERERSRVERK